MTIQEVTNQTQIHKHLTHPIKYVAIPVQTRKIPRYYLLISQTKQELMHISTHFKILGQVSIKSSLLSLKPTQEQKFILSLQICLEYQHKPPKPNQSPSTFVMILSAKRMVRSTGIILKKLMEHILDQRTWKTGNLSLV